MYISPIISSELDEDGNFVTTWGSFNKIAIKFGIVQIIGRDILLSDVLAAMIDRIKKQLTDEYREDFSGLQGYIEEVVTWACNKIIRSWNLLRPSLDDQEEATISLIYEILCTAG